MAGGLVHRDLAVTAAVLTDAAATMTHRGPDGSGSWVSRRDPVGFGHRRLAVIDLRDVADQPMVLEDPTERALTFNGEIYNYRQLRADLESNGEAFRSAGDTEVLLRSCRRHGVLATLAGLRGMFAFAYYDEHDRSLWLVRDRFGEKPLYYAFWAGGIAFASELRGLRAIPDFPTDLDPVGVELLLRHSCIGGERTIYRAARKVGPGVALRVEVSDRITEASIVRHRYWSAEDVAAAAAADRFEGGIGDAADELDQLLRESVLAATVSDVPLGAFLSGGVDSTSVVSQLARHATASVKTFTIGFTAGTHSEADSARAIARHLGTDHTDLVLTPEHALAVVPELCSIYDEPFADSSQLPTHLVARLARQHVTVALSGDGGDELFGGYGRFELASRMWHAVDRVPDRLRRPVAAGLMSVPPHSWERIGHLAGRGPLRRLRGRTDERMAKIAAVLRATRPDDVYRLVNTSFWEQSPLRAPPVVAPRRLPDGPTTAERMMLHDTITYLPDDILTKVDRATMAVSIETRVPMLTPELFAFAARLPPSYKLGERGAQKRVLRELLARHVPRPLWDGSKRGFSVPLDAWLRGALREWAGDLISPRALAAHGIFDDGVVARLWTEHITGERDWSSRLWNIVMFQAWHERWMHGEAVTSTTQP